MIYIEKLTGFSILYLFFYLSTIRFLSRKDDIYYLDASNNGLILENYINRFFSVRINKLKFSYVDVIDDDGVNCGMNILYEDIPSLWKTLVNKGHFDLESFSQEKDDWIMGYIKKTLFTQAAWPGINSTNSLRNILLFFYASKLKSINKKSDSIPVIIIDRKPWIFVLSNFASEMGVRLFIMNNKHTSFLIRLKNEIIRSFQRIKNLRFGKIFRYSRSNGKMKSKTNFVNDLDPNTPKIVVDQVMQMFPASTFWSESQLTPNNIFFVSMTHKINKNVLKDIQNCGMKFVALSSVIAEGLDVPIYDLRRLNSFEYRNNFLKDSSSLESHALNKFIKEFNGKMKSWVNFFKATGTRIYVSHDKWSNKSVAAGAALDELGGISALWQTSFYESPSPHTSVYADIYFPFSNKVAEIEKKMNSKIKYNIAIGYTRDFMFDNLKDRAITLRTKLKDRGCKKIISFFDQGSIDNERWGVSHSTIQSEYEFWLNKVLEEEWVGLIIKPKIPGTLIARLGDTATLLQEAVETGRCHIFLSNELGKNFADSPALAALASDVAVHNVLTAGTAGLEASLTGTPTLLFDLFGWVKKSQFYQLGNNKVVFNDWDVLWNNLYDHLKKVAIPGFGDWSPIIDDLDPFRDGKAAYRMTTYLYWLLEGFKQGLDRETILADAAERYANEWGDDKVVCMV